MMQPASRSLVTCLAAAVATVAGAASAVADDPVQRVFEVDQGDRLVLDTDFGRVDVKSSDRSSIEVVIENPDDLEFQFDQADGVVTITGRMERRPWAFWNWDRLAFWNWERLPRFRLDVPYRHDVDLRTVGGDIAIDRLQGEVLARTSGGDVRLGEIDGPVQARTSGGDVRIGSVNGAVEARTSGGSIETASVAGEVSARTSGGSIRIGGAAGAVEAHTTGGSISVEFVAQPNAPSTLRTSGGSVTAYLAEDIAVDVEAKTSGGRVSTDFPVSVVGEVGARNRLETALNGGGPAMALRTSGGSIRLRRLDR